MGFQNPVSGAQGSLERQQIKSPNYAPGSAGWAIKRDGSAEFNNITIRGATSVGGVSLWYSGAPATGNLVYSISSTAGTDAYGNHYAAGMVSYSTLFTNDIAINNGTVLMGTASADFLNGATIFNSLTAGGEVAVYTGTGDTNHSDAVHAYFTAGTGAQPSGGAHTPHFAVVDALGTSAADVYMTGSVVPIKAGSGGALETWQTPTYAANWAAGTTSIGGTGLHFRRTAEDDLWLYGIAASSAGASNTVFTLPAAYQVAAGALFASPHGAANLIRGTTVTTVEVAIDTSGNVLVGGNPQAGDLYSFNLRVPLGHLA